MVSEGDAWVYTRTATAANHMLTRTLVAWPPANHRQDQAALSLLVNWKYPDFWRYKHEVKKPVRFHRVRGCSVWCGSEGVRVMM